VTDENNYELKVSTYNITDIAARSTGLEKNTNQKTKKKSNSEILDINRRKNTQNHDKTRALLQTTGGKDEPNMFLC
jgi:hypothetical protein